MSTAGGDVPDADTLANLTLLGVTIDGAHFKQRNDGSLVPDPAPAWQPVRNGNPPNMLDVTRSLMEDHHRRVLFILERDTNRNVVLYLHDSSTLVSPLWLMIPGAPVHYNSDEPLSDDVEIELGDVYVEEMTPLESTIGYGVRTDERRQHVYVQALKKQPIYVREVDGEWHAFIQIADGAPLMILRRISIVTEPRPFAPWPRVVGMHIEAQQTLSGPLIVYRYGV
jgi:hypothetical protein